MWIIVTKLWKRTSQSFLEDVLFVHKHKKLKETRTMQYEITFYSSRLERRRKAKRSKIPTFGDYVVVGLIVLFVIGVNAALAWRDSF